MLNREPFRLLGADRRLLAPAVIAGVWALVAMAAAAQAIALVRLDGRANMAEAVLGRLSILPLWALATPLILRSARRFPVVGSNRQPSVLVAAIHVALGSLFIVLANVAIRVPAALAPVADGGGFAALVRSTLQGMAEFYPAALVVYGVSVAIGHVLHRPSLPSPALADSEVASPIASSASPASVVATAGGVRMRGNCCAAR